MKTLKHELTQIGTVETDKGFSIKLEKEFVKGLKALEGFSYVQVLWFANKAPEWNDEMLEMDAPYKGSPSRMGVFATRSPVRPNGICVSNAEVISIDKKTGVIQLAWIDAEDGTPVVDIKPYHPSSERVLSATVPDWCKDWPKSLEESGDFNWGEVFLF